MAKRSFASNTGADEKSVRITQLVQSYTGAYAVEDLTHMRAHPGLGYCTAIRLKHPLPEVIRTRVLELPLFQPHTWARETGESSPLIVYAVLDCVKRVCSFGLFELLLDTVSTTFSRDSLRQERRFWQWPCKVDRNGSRCGRSSSKHHLP